MYEKSERKEKKQFTERVERRRSCGSWKIFKLNGTRFDDLLQMIDEILKEGEPVMWIIMPVATKLENTLNFLSTCNSYKYPDYFGSSTEIILKFMLEVVLAITRALQTPIEIR